MSRSSTRRSALGSDCSRVNMSVDRVRSLIWRAKSRLRPDLVRAFRADRPTMLMLCNAATYSNFETGDTQSKPGGSRSGFPPHAPKAASGTGIESSQPRGTREVCRRASRA